MLLMMMPVLEIRSTVPPDIVETHWVVKSPLIYSPLIYEPKTIVDLKKNVFTLSVSSKHLMKPWTSILTNAN